MAGYLDQEAESIEFEYAIRCEPDYLGKTVFKNFCLNILKLSQSCLEIPLSKAGGDSRGFVGDARIIWIKHILNIEIKFSHLLPHQTAGDNWAFTRVLRTKKGQIKRQFDLLFCVGLLTRDPAHFSYWQHRQTIKSRFGKRPLNLNAKPYQKDFLNLCNFYILPYREIRVNNDFRRYLRTYRDKPDFRFFSSGQDPDQCRAIWHDAVSEAVLTKLASKKSRQPARFQSEDRFGPQLLT